MDYFGNSSIETTSGSLTTTSKAAMPEDESLHDLLAEMMLELLALPTVIPGSLGALLHE